MISIKKSALRLVSLVAAAVVTGSLFSVLGGAHAATSTTVKKATPVLDGVMDCAYADSASIRTLDFARSGKMLLGMPSLSSAKASAYVSAGILSSASSTTLLTGGNYDVAAFPKAEIYIVWDDGALYFFSKVYDSDIQVPDKNTVQNIVANSPWLTDSVTHLINPLESIYANIKAYGLIGGSACWDADGIGYSSLGSFTNQTAAQRAADAANVASVVNAAEGWYTVEMRVPISSADFGGTPLNSLFPKSGSTFTYNFYVTDGENGLQDNGFHANNQAIYMSSEGTVMTLSGEAADGHTVTVTEGKNPTCTESGYTAKSECSGCGAVFEESVVLPATGHSFAGAYCTACGYEDPEYMLRGDVNRDGAVDSDDSIYLLNATFDAARYPLDQSGDMNGDGYFDSDDAVALLRYCFDAERFPIADG